MTCDAFPFFFAVGLEEGHVPTFWLILYRGACMLTDTTKHFFSRAPASRSKLRLRLQLVLRRQPALECLPQGASHVHTSYTPKEPRLSGVGSQ